MDEKSKYDVMCIERGDIEYISHVAEMLLSEDVMSKKEIENIALALIGIVKLSYELKDVLPKYYRI